MPIASAAAIAALVAAAGARREVQGLALPLAAATRTVTETHTVMVPVTRTVTDTEYRDVPESVTETHIKRVPVTRTVTTTEYRQQPVTVTETVQEPRYETVQVPIPPPKDLDTKGYWRRWLAHPFHTVTRFVGYFARTVTRTEMRTVPVQVQKTVTEYEERPVTTTVTRLVRRAVPVTRQETVMEPRTVTETRQAPVDPPQPAPALPPAPPPPPLQPRRRSAAELAEERDPQRNAKVVPLFPPGSKPPEQELNQLILQAKQEYDTAQAQGNTGGMQAAHQRAEWLRSLGGIYGAGQSTAEVQEREVDRLNAGILQAKANYAAAAARGDAKGMAASHDRAEELRRQGGTVATAETLDEAKLHLQTDVDRHITQDKAHYAEGTAADQRLAQQRAEEARKLAGGVGVQTIGADVTLADAREQAQAEANRQVVIDKAVYDRAQAAGDTASMKLAHQDAQAQRNAGAGVGSGENQQQARDHLQQILDTEIVTHKDAWQSTTDQAARTHEHRQADVLRQVGQSVGVGTIGQEASLGDAQVQLVLKGGPLVAGGKATEIGQGDISVLQSVEAAIEGGQPDVQAMRDLFQGLTARAGAGDTGAAAALTVLRTQAEKSGVDLNPPPPPPVYEIEAGYPTVTDYTSGPPLATAGANLILIIRPAPEHSEEPPKGFLAKLWNFTDKVFGFSALGQAFDGVSDGTGSLWDFAKALGRTGLMVVGAAAVVGAGIVLGAYALGATATLAALGGTIGTVFTAGGIVTIAAFGGGWAAMDSAARGASAGDIAAEGLQGAFASAPLGLLGSLSRKTSGPSRDPLVTDAEALTTEARDQAAEARTAQPQQYRGFIGRAIGDHDAMNPGPLGDTIQSPAATFSGGHYRVIATTEDSVLYRVHTNLVGRGQGARELGPFWSPERPGGSLQAQIDAALNPAWGNSATYFTTIRVPAGTVLYVGEASSQGGPWVGGKTQVFIGNSVSPDWVIERGRLP